VAKRGKRGKKRLAKLRKKLGFVPSITKIAGPRFGSMAERIDAHGHACTLDKTKREIQAQLDRKQKQKGWDEH
jgi:hypothetical protein